MITKYQFISDLGHGWLKVKIRELDELGINDKISGYSYKRGQYAFLEEDCDLSIFAHAKRASGVEIEFIYSQSTKRSKIRSYERFRSVPPFVRFGN